MGKWTRLLDVYSDIEEDESFSHLRKPGIRLVPGDGAESAETARVMVVGEAPGARENGSGRPFVGASGRVLEGLLGLAGLSRESVFITNIVKYRPPGNRTPTVGEVFAATPYVRREWNILKPALTIAVGATAHGVLHPAGYGMSLSMTRRGELWEYTKSQGHWITSQYHPAFGLRDPRFQPRMEQEWETLGSLLKEMRLW